MNDLYVQGRRIASVSPPVTYGLLVLGWFLLLGFALSAAALGGVAPNVRAFQVAYVVGFIGYGVLIGVLARSRERTKIGRWRWWFAGCVALRLLLATTEPTDDAFRYVWEGRVQRAGYNPYRHAPDDPVLAPLRDDSWCQINHPHVPAIYPPLAQMEFVAAASVYPSTYTVKGFHVAWDVCVVAVLAACLRRKGKRPHWAAVYALCPLVLSAFAVEGHLDSLMLLLVVATAWAVMAGRLKSAGLLLGLAIAAKTVPVVLLPWLAWRHRRSAVIAVATVALCYGPYLISGRAGLANLWQFAEGGVLLSLLALAPASAVDTAIARYALATVLALTSLVLAWRRRDFIQYAAEMTAVLVLLLPIVHYWYLTWILLFQPFQPRIRWLVAALLMVVYFEAARSAIVCGEWTMPRWAPVAIWAPFCCAWLIEAAIRRRGTLEAR